MRITQKTIYALQFLIYLRLYSSTRYVQVKEVSEHQNISEKYLEAIVARLKNDNLVTVKRGAHGGYMLSEKGQKATLKDVTDSVEVWSTVNQYSSNHKGNSILDSIIKILLDAENDYARLVDSVEVERMANEANTADQFAYSI
jgi:Rrf2 family transcriptional regulator, cysteine metabolism repressor